MTIAHRATSCDKGPCPGHEHSPAAWHQTYEDCRGERFEMYSARSLSGNSPDHHTCTMISRRFSSCFLSSKQHSHLPGMKFKNSAYPIISKPHGSFTFLLRVENLIKPEYDISAAVRKYVLEHF